MARTAYKGPIAGGYVTHRLVCRTTIVGNASNTRVDYVTMDQDFVVCHISFDALDVTAVTNALITPNNSTGSICGQTVVSAGTPKAVIPAAMTAGKRLVRKGDALELRVYTDAGGGIPAGGLVANVTGYFVSHNTNNARFAESGQGKMAGPCTGFYTLLPLSNLRASNNQAERVEGSLIVPFACRVMAITYGIIGHTKTTGAIAARVKNGTSGNFLHTALDIDAMSGDVARIDALSSPALIAANRNLSRGDALELHLTTGLADTVPIQALSAYVWVWVTGHVDFSNAVDADLDHPGGITGPAIGGYVVVPFLQKRASQSGLRAEDEVFLPVALRLVAAKFSRHSAASANASIANSGVGITNPFPTTVFVVHNEGNNLPAPSNVTGNVLIAGVPAGEDHASRNFSALSRMQLGLQSAIMAALNQSAWATCTVKSHFYDDSAND